LEPNHLETWPPVDEVDDKKLQACLPAVKEFHMATSVPFALLHRLHIEESNFIIPRPGEENAGYFLKPYAYASRFSVAVNYTPDIRQPDAASQCSSARAQRDTQSTLRMICA
jgi:hypothetical protein